MVSQKRAPYNVDHVLPLEYLTKAKETSVWFELLYFCCCYCFICFLVIGQLLSILTNNLLDIRKE